jgi:hypothetical protein
MIFYLSFTIINLLVLGLFVVFLFFLIYSKNIKMFYLLFWMKQKEREEKSQGLLVLPQSANWLWFFFAVVCLSLAIVIVLV